MSETENQGFQSGPQDHSDAKVNDQASQAQVAPSSDEQFAAGAAASASTGETAGEATAQLADEALTDMSASEEQVEDSDLANALEKIANFEDQLARAHADLYNLNQEYSNYVRRAKEAAPGHRESGQTEVIEALISVLDDIDAARTHGELEDGPFAAIATKLESVLASRFNLERYGAAGEEFDPAQHEALLANVNPEVQVATIAQILQPGYRRDEKILRAAKVMVDNPE